MPRLFRRLAALLRPGRDRDLAEEMQFHQDQQQADGLSPAQAQRAFGNDLLLRERSRDAWGWLWLEQLGQDLRHTARHLRRSPAYALLAIGILALGIGANTALFTVFDAVLLRPLPYPHPERLVNFTGANATRMVALPTLHSEDASWLGDVHSFAGIAIFEPGEINFSTTSSGTLPERVRATEVSIPFFRVMGIAPLGPGFRPGEDAPGHNQVVVLSQVLAQRFGSPASMVGRTIALNGKPYRVAGVMPVGFDFPDRSELWIPRANPWTPSQEPFAANVIWTSQIARLRPGITREEARRELIHIASAPPASVRVTPIRTELTEDARPVLLLLLAAVGLVLCIACANVANLQLARALRREQETALRVALGATRGRLARQHLAESLSLALLGGGGGSALAWLSLPALRPLLPLQLPLAQPLRLDGRVLAFALAAAAISSLVIGLIPALHAFRHPPNSSLKNAPAPHRSLLRSALATIEIALAMVLLAGAGLLLQSLWRQAAAPPGFDPHGLLTAQIRLGEARYALPASRIRFFDAVLRRASTLPGVTGAAIATNLPMMGGSYFLMPVLPGGTTLSASSPRARVSSVSPDYFRVLHIPPRSGRWFSDTDEEGTPKVAILSQDLASALWSHADPLGRQFTLAGMPGNLRVVGVVGNTRLNPGADPEPIVYVPLSQNASALASIVVRGARDPAMLAAPLRRAVTAVDPNEPLSQIATMAELESADLGDPRFRTILLSLFAALALALSVTGLGGVLAYAATQRTQEIGVRMALGARPGQVLRLVLAQGLRLVALGISLGLVGALALAHLLANLLYGISAYDPVTLVGMAALMAITSSAACWLPARRAARVDPMASLRCE